MICQALNSFKEMVGSDILLTLFIWFTDTPGDPQQVETDNRFLVVELLKNTRVHVKAGE